MKEKRAEQVLRELFPSLKRRHAKEALDHGLVRTQNGLQLSKGQFLPESTQLDTSLLTKHLLALKEQFFLPSIAIISEQSDFFVVDKPAGVASVPISLFDRNTMTHWAYTYHPDIQEAFPEIQPEVVPHRLDTQTTGLQIVSKTKENQARLLLLFRQGQVTKHYLAWCWGLPEKESYRLEQYFRSHHKKMVLSENPADLHALSEIQVIKVEPDDRAFLCKVKMQTGIRHQVRAQLSALGFPLIGDSLYDSEFLHRPVRPKSHLLRACYLEFDKYQFSLTGSYDFPK